MESGPLLVFSPHLDDAVLSLGNLITAHPGSIVVTVLAGMPDDETLATEWDATCGFGNAGDSMRARWDEDTDALAELGATAIHLGHLDGQYGVADLPAIVEEIERIIGEHPARQIYGPFGLVHRDHILVSDAFVGALSRTEFDGCRLYADIPYYAAPGSLDRRRAELEERGVAIGPIVEVSDVRDAKLRARNRYASQLRALAGMPLDLAEMTATITCTSRR